MKRFFEVARVRFSNPAQLPAFLLEGSRDSAPVSMFVGAEVHLPLPGVHVVFDMQISAVVFTSLQANGEVLQELAVPLSRCEWVCFPPYDSMYGAR